MLNPQIKKTYKKDQSIDPLENNRIHVFDSFTHPWIVLVQKSLRFGRWNHKSGTVDENGEERRGDEMRWMDG
ncbi:hypothetical protein EYC84_000702 [Monilinia fructicola]|uniref:Uncharacterized protein n=1 Tax=Monilinia fructicola TaxID=38448 RepID=A0A5M9JM10_MONFR|nr:hypothetical protein EYC84_000702 [Monilinia fructicola]